MVAALPALLASLATAADAPRTLATPFVGEEGGYSVYRIPSLLVGKNGTLLAFAEGRANLHDQAENNIVLRRSGDEGKTWEPLQVVAGDGHNALNNPTGVLLHESGRILLMYQRYPQALPERKVKEGISGDETCLSFITSSDDEGKTWSKPLDITAQVKRPKGATSIASGPGVGIEVSHGKHAGRIIFPFNQGPLNNCQVYAVYSDDGGKSWRYGGVAPTSADGRGNEVQMVELSDGRVMLNSRGSSGEYLRKTAVSDDGGESWTQLQNAAALPESQCQASIIRYDEPRGVGKGPLLFVNPAVTRGRAHGTIRLSEDDGATWPISRELVAGDFAYSCLAVLPDKSILCLYETDKYRRIELIRFSIDWVRAGDRH
jgi:sialidase-1